MKIVRDTDEELTLHSGRAGATVGGLVLILIALLIGFFSLQTRTIACTRDGDALVECELRAALFGAPLGTEYVGTLTGAEVEINEDSDGDTYRVALKTAAGKVPFTSFWSSGFGPKQELARDIDAFVQSHDSTLPTGLVGSLSTFVAAALLFVFGLVFVLTPKTMTATFNRATRQVKVLRRGLARREELAFSFDELRDVELRPRTNTKTTAHDLFFVMNDGREFKLNSVSDADDRLKAIAPKLRAAVGLPPVGAVAASA